MSAEPAAARAPARRRPGRGYALAAAGATMWAMNGNLARYLLDDGVSAVRLAQLRSAGSWLLLLFGLGLARRDLIPVRRRELPALAFLGIAGLALVHATYFVAIQHLEIGVAVTIQYLAPLVLLVWLRLVQGGGSRRACGGRWPYRWSGASSSCAPTTPAPSTGSGSPPPSRP